MGQRLLAAPRPGILCAFGHGCSQCCGREGLFAGSSDESAAHVHFTSCNCFPCPLGQSQPSWGGTGLLPGRTGCPQGRVALLGPQLCHLLSAVRLSGPKLESWAGTFHFCAYSWRWAPRESRPGHSDSVAGPAPASRCVLGKGKGERRGWGGCREAAVVLARAIRQALELDLLLLRNVGQHRRDVMDAHGALASVS